MKNKNSISSICILLFILICSATYAQKNIKRNNGIFTPEAPKNNKRYNEVFTPELLEVIERVQKIDFLSLDYKYLDTDFKIVNISSDTFNKAVEKCKFYPDRIKRYRDSLGVVLSIEFETLDIPDNEKEWMSNIAKKRIGYSWKRLGYHTWQTEKEAKDFAICFGITHPWRMKEFLIDETNNGKMITDFFEDLKQNVKAEYKTISFDDLSREETLTLAMQKNPVRIKDFQELQYKRRHGKVDPEVIGVGCGKENCCQKKGEE